MVFLMPRSARPRSQPVLTTLPADLQPAALVLEMVSRLGLIDRVDRDLALSRRNGHTGNSLFSLAVLLLMSGPAWGIRPFTERLKGAVGRTLAAIGGVANLPSSASVSRALASLPQTRARACIDQLLLTPNGMRSLLSSPHVLHRDATGRSWHVVDVDPTVVPFRQRALPEGPELPDPVRLVPGEPGYVGHKRGELRVRVVPIVHSGAALWFGVRRMTEEGSAVHVAGELVQLARAAVKDARPGAGLVVRYDGEFGSVGAMRATLDAGADVLTRLTRYTLLDSPEAAAVLSSPAWHPVPSGGSGPPREAAEFGSHTLKPSARAAGSKEPVTVRVVVTRIPRVGPATHGIVREGYQYELFATSLPPAGWPAEDLVNLYFGRAAIECRFAQEDREFALDRTFSNSPAGQEWMVGVGLFLWNLLVCKGVELNPFPAKAPKQAQRPAEPAPVVVCSDKPAELAVATQGAAAVEGDATTPDVSAPAAPHRQPNAPQPPTLAATEVPPARREARPKTAEAALWAIVCDLFADLQKRPDWTFDHKRKRLFCPNKTPFIYLTARRCDRPAQREKGFHNIRIQPAKGACESCPLREDCIGARGPGGSKATVKTFIRRVPEATGLRVVELLEARKLEPRRELRDDGPLRQAPPVDYTPAEPRQVGDRAIVTPLFCPAEARKRARSELAGQRVEFLLHPAVGRPRRRHPLLARDDDDRQHRRATWAQRRSARSNLEWIEVRPAGRGSQGRVCKLIGLPRT